MRAEVALRPAAELLPVYPLESAARGLADPSIDAAVAGLRSTQSAARLAWSQWLASLTLGPVEDVDEDEDDEVWAAEDTWVSPLAGRRLPAVKMDWASLDWRRSGRDAA